MVTGLVASVMWAPAVHGIGTCWGVPVPPLRRSTPTTANLTWPAVASWKVHVIEGSLRVFWLVIVAAIVVVGLGLAWWTSGRAPGAQNQGDPHRRWTDEGKGNRPL